MKKKEDKFEALLRHSKGKYLGLPVQRTSECPSEEDLHSLCLESNDGALRQKFMSHVILCRYCGDFIHREIRQLVAARKLSDMKEKLFPLPDEIKWNHIKAVVLFRENVRISEQKVIGEIKECEFEISEAGFYHITIGSGQILWGRAIESAEITLTDDEQKQALDYGVAASKEDEAPRIIGFIESHWENKLVVELVKRIDGCVLIVKLANE